MFKMCVHRCCRGPTLSAQDTERLSYHVSCLPQTVLGPFAPLWILSSGAPLDLCDSSHPVATEYLREIEAACNQVCNDCVYGFNAFITYLLQTII